MFISAPWILLNSYIQCANSYGIKIIPNIGSLHIFRDTVAIYWDTDLIIMFYDALSKSKLKNIRLYHKFVGLFIPDFKECPYRPKNKKI